MLNRHRDNVALRAANVRVCVIVDHRGLIHDGAVVCFQLEGGQNSPSIAHNCALMYVDNNVTLLGLDDSQTFRDVEFADSVVTESNKINGAAGAVPDAHVGSNDGAVSSPIQKGTNKIAEGAHALDIDAILGSAQGKAL